MAFYKTNKQKTRHTKKQEIAKNINLRNDIGTGKHQFQNIPSKKLNIY